uniref:Reticulon 4 receptor like 2 n=1 Tax=Catharus ustulatus TaxID=91951 RepID=A0A8C3UYI8_CATUS
GSGTRGRPAALLLLAALVWVPGGAPACPALCTCYVSPPTVSCQANNFSSVPAGLPPGARRLFLQNNVIGGVFRGLSSLDRLLLHANRLAAIHRRAFGGLARLTILYLFNNSLVALPGDPLAALPSLQFLRLNANPWACDCRARPLWAWFRRTRVSSSPVPCASPPGVCLYVCRLSPRGCPSCPLPCGSLAVPTWSLPWQRCPWDVPTRSHPCILNWGWVSWGCPCALPLQRCVPVQGPDCPLW